MGRHVVTPLAGRRGLARPARIEHRVVAVDGLENHPKRQRRPGAQQQPESQVRSAARQQVANLRRFVEHPGPVVTTDSPFEQQFLTRAAFNDAVLVRNKLEMSIDDLRRRQRGALFASAHKTADAGEASEPDQTKVRHTQANNDQRHPLGAALFVRSRGSASR